MLSDWSNVDSRFINSNRYITSYCCNGYYKKSLVTHSLMKIKKALKVTSTLVCIKCYNNLYGNYLSIKKYKHTSYYWLLSTRSFLVSGLELLQFCPVKCSGKWNSLPEHNSPSPYSNNMY